jgi:hypothetical protein
MKAHTKKLAVTVVLKNSDKDSRDAFKTYTKGYSEKARGQKDHFN